MGFIFQLILGLSQNDSYCGGNAKMIFIPGGYQGEQLQRAALESKKTRTNAPAWSK